MHPLKEFLAGLSVGTITDTASLEAVLAVHWDEFSGGGFEGMRAHKLHSRVEDAHWDPPILTFIIERHGGTVMGSSRAEKHRWTLDLDKLSAVCEQVGSRQLEPQAPRLNVRPLAEEVAEIVLIGKQDERVKWSRDGSVRVQIGKILPEWSANKQTLAGRRKRFRMVLDELLTRNGWRKVRENQYAPK